MKLLALFCMLLIAAMSSAQSPRSRILLDAGWRFHLGSAGDVAKDFGYGGGQTFAKAGSGPGPIRPGYNDSSWRQMDLPHDWVVEEDFVHDDDGLYVQHGSKPIGRKYPDFAVGWYRRSFDIPIEDKGRRLSVEFDGVFRDSLVWLNGHLLGRHESGYSSFAYDMTDYINYGGANVLTVRVDASQYEGWFYEGAGIYRHVWLVKTSPVHIAHWGTYVTSEVNGDKADITIHTMLVNESDTPVRAQLEYTLFDPAGKPVPAMPSSSDDVRLMPWTKQEVVQRSRLTSPSLWSIERPSLYRLQTSVLQGVDIGPLPTLKNGGGVIDGATVDRNEVAFGIRTIRFDKDQGFFLNGKRVEIKGTCNHQDHGGLGSALPDGMQYFRIQKLKEMGCNAIRTSHNPPTPELLDACDRMGMLVMDENRLLSSSAESMSDLESLVLRDRNHPSVILWSIGNEEPEQGTPIGAQVATTMARRVRELDPTRPVTYAGNNGTEYDGVNSVVDVRGVNYIALGSTDEYHKSHPDQPMIGSEEASTLSTRGEYANDPVRGYMSAYDVNKPGWGALAEEWWTYYAARPYLAGAFVWTGFDYRGEPTPYGWPCISSHFGIMDTCGFPKDNYYYYQSWWSDKPVLHLLPHWNWQGKEGKPIDVWCYSNQDEVELFLNGKSLGRKPMPRNGHLEWSVPYEPGTLEAHGYYTDSRPMVVEKVETTGAPDHLVLAQDPASHVANGLGVVTVSVVDAHGRVVPDAGNDVFFLVDDGTILGVGNGDPSSHERDKFVDSVTTRAVDGWKRYDGLSSTAILPSSIKEKGGKPIDVSGDGGGMAEHSISAYVASFDLDAATQGKLMLSIGQVDDLGWVYVNDKLAGKTTDWDSSYAFDIARFVHVGKNKVVIFVKNDAGPGGLGRGVSLSWSKPAEKWHRSVFHGLAQIILQPADGQSSMLLQATSPGLKQSVLTVRVFGN